MTVSRVKEIMLETRHRVEMVDVTNQLQQVVSDSGLTEGVLVATVTHTTAGLTINENADPDVVQDLLHQWEHLAPRQGAYQHAEGNADAHIKSTLIGSSLQILVTQGRLLLGTWQGIFFCEFDGPRRRRIVARVLG